MSPWRSFGLLALALIAGAWESAALCAQSGEPSQARQVDLAKPFGARSPWRFVVTEGPPTEDYGGNGFALEYPISRVLCDARILNIFEGAAEIQAHVIARGLLAGRN